jgi:phospholipid/cholesterol/gamma-HCH transport system ATP-binding protein
MTLQQAFAEDRTDDADRSHTLAIETRDLHKAFGPNKILNGTDLQIPEGSLCSIMGPSGTGKSVLIKHVVGLLSADEGEVIVRGHALSKMSRDEILALRREVGIMFQDGALFSSMNIYDNVAFPLRQHTSLKEPDVKEIVEMHLASVGLSHAGTRFPSQLSGGMKKRAGLARSMVLDPAIILCDEPDSGLDPVRAALLGELLIERHSEVGGTMVVITHDIALARRVSDYVVVVWRGKVVAAGPAKEMWGSDDPFIRQFLKGFPYGPLDMDA